MCGGQSGQNIVASHSDNFHRSRYAAEKFPTQRHFCHQRKYRRLDNRKNSSGQWLFRGYHVRQHFRQDGIKQKSCAAPRYTVVWFWWESNSRVRKNIFTGLFRYNSECNN
jgi:hypothetical protein